MQWLIWAHSFYDVSTLIWANYQELNFGREYTKFFQNKKLYPEFTKPLQESELWLLQSLLWVAISVTLRQQRSLLETSALQCHSNHPAKGRELWKLLKRLKKTDLN